MSTLYSPVLSMYTIFSHSCQSVQVSQYCIHELLIAGWTEVAFPRRFRLSRQILQDTKEVTWVVSSLTVYVQKPCRTDYGIIKLPWQCRCIPYQDLNKCVCISPKIFKNMNSRNNVMMVRVWVSVSRAHNWL